MARCIGETRALTHNAEAMRDALEAGDTARLASLVESQEMGIWRLGQLLKGQSPDEGGRSEPGDLASAAQAAADDEEGLRQTLSREMRALADVSRQNAVLLRDGLTMVRGLLAILTGQYRNYGGDATGPASAFSRRA